MKLKVLKVTNLILAILLVLFTIGYTYAWFANYYSVDIKLYADPNTGYFAGGDGTEDNPYIIATYKHLYNLAWLQNTGKFSSEKTYFKISDDVDEIDMCASDTYFVIPPIGNDKYPFTGEFDGNGKTIKNLIVSTDKNKLTNFPNESASGYAFSKYVGLFGITGSESVITNFILDDPIVEVSSKNTNYSTGGSCCCGLAIGYVSGNASSIGVIGGTLAVQQTGYKTYNSILGAFDEDTIYSNVTGNNVGFGGSLDIRSLMYRMYYISSNSWSSPSLNFNGLTSSSSSHPNSGSYMSLIVDNNVEEDEGAYYKTNTSEEVSLNNIGYYTGNQAKIEGKYTYEQLWAEDCYTKNGQASKLSGGSTSGGNVSSSLIGSLTDVKIYEFTYDSSGTSKLEKSQNITSDVKSDVLKLLNKEYIYTITFSGQVEVNNWVTIENATVAGNTYSKINVPPKTLWFTPQEDGMVKIVYLTENNSQRDISLYEITRSDQGSVNSFYSTSTSGISIIQISSVYKYTDEDGETAYEYNNNTHNGTLIYQREYWNPHTYDDMVIYMEIPVYAGKEYAFGAVNSAEAYVLYMDIGQNAKITTKDKTIENIDFIYDGVEIVNGEFVLESDNSTAYVETGTMIYLSTSASVTTTAVLVLAFTRSYDDSDNDGYYGTTTYTLYVAYYTEDTTGTDVPSQSVSGMALIESDAKSSDYFSYYYKVDDAFS